MHFEDLAPYGMLAEFAPGMRVKAVGWLQRGSQFQTGRVDPRVISRLFEDVNASWGGRRFYCMGYHPCDLCPNAPQRTGTPVVWQEPGAVDSASLTATVGGAELYVPGNGLVYIAPSMILHYILSHDYCPPPEFAEAVLNSPKVGTPEYIRAVQANGGEQYVK